MPIEQVLMQIKDEPSFQWPQPMLALVEGRDISRYSKFHQDHKANMCSPICIEIHPTPKRQKGKRN